MVRWKPLPYPATSSLATLSSRRTNPTGSVTAGVGGGGGVRRGRNHNHSLHKPPETQALNVVASSQGIKKKSCPLPK